MHRRRWFLVTLRAAFALVAGANALGVSAQPADPHRAGEVDVGLTAYQANAESFRKRGAPVDWAPVEPVIARPQRIGVPHPNATLLCADFMLSPATQAMFAGMGRTPVCRAVTAGTSALNYVLSDPAVVLDESDKWQGLWDKFLLGK